MMTPMPTQLTGAAFLAARATALRNVSMWFLSFISAFMAARCSSSVPLSKARRLAIAASVSRSQSVRIAARRRFSTSRRIWSLKDSRRLTGLLRRAS